MLWHHIFKLQLTKCPKPGRIYKVNVSVFPLYAQKGSVNILNSCKKLMAGKKTKCTFKLLHHGENTFSVIIINGKYVRMGKNEEKRPKD